MTEKRYMIDFENKCITDTITNKDYSMLIEFKQLLNALYEENQSLKQQNNEMYSDLQKINKAYWDLKFTHRDFCNEMNTIFDTYKGMR